jgi:hypothetical protein
MSETTASLTRKISSAGDLHDEGFGRIEHWAI